MMMMMRVKWKATSHGTGIFVFEILPVVTSKYIQCGVDPGLVTKMIADYVGRQCGGMWPQ